MGSIPLCGRVGIRWESLAGAPHLSQVSAHSARPPLCPDEAPPQGPAASTGAHVLVPEGPGFWQVIEEVGWCWWLLSPSYPSCLASGFEVTLAFSERDGWACAGGGGGFIAQFSPGGAASALGPLEEFSSSPRRPMLLLAWACLVPSSYKGRPRPRVCKPHQSHGALFSNKPSPGSLIWGSRGAWPRRE